MLELPQGAQLGTTQRMRTGHPILPPADMQQAGIKVDLVPAQRDQLTDPQRMTVGHQNHRGIPMTVAADAPGGLHQGINFTRRQVLPTTALGVGDPPRRTCRLNNPIYEP